MKLTAFESEIVDSILWQVEGFKIGRVTKRATSRILRATIRRIKPRLIACSEAAQENDYEIDHAIPVHVLCEWIMTVQDLDRSKIERMLSDWLVTVKLTGKEHREVLQKSGFASCMPRDWDKANPFARYQAAGIRLLEINPKEDAGS